MNLNDRNKAILALISANIIWGAASPIFKLALENITPFTLAYLRFFLAAILLFPFAAKHLWIKREDLGDLVLLSFFGITVNITFFFFGLRLTPSINAPIIGSTGPVLGYIASIIFLHEKPKFKVLSGTLVSLLGIFIILFQPILTRGLDGQVLGNLFLLIATIGAVEHSIFSKKSLGKYHTMTVTFWSFIIGSITFFPMFIYELYKYHPLNALDVRGISGLIFGIFFSSALAYYLFEWGLKRVFTQEVGIFTYIDPIVAAVLAWFLLGESITTLFLGGSFLVFFGIFIAEGRLHWHPIHKLR